MWTKALAGYSESSSEDCRRFGSHRILRFGETRSRKKARKTASHGGSSAATTLIPPHSSSPIMQTYMRPSPISNADRPRCQVMGPKPSHSKLRMGWMLQRAPISSTTPPHSICSLSSAELICFDTSSSTPIVSSGTRTRPSATAILHRVNESLISVSSAGQFMALRDGGASLRWPSRSLRRVCSNATGKSIRRRHAAASCDGLVQIPGAVLRSRFPESFLRRHSTVYFFCSTTK
jgi:hypothetical protein